MTNEEAKKYASNMTYTQAVYNAISGKSIPYRKATMIKLHELLAKAFRLIRGGGSFGM